jgi:Pyridoxamine 5'-phosphate oxidase
VQTVSSTEFNSEVGRYLREHHAVTLSTASFTGLPHANTAPYVSDDHRMYFFARDGSILLSNLAQSHSAAFTIDDYTSRWQKRRELHGRGSCGIADDLQARVALKLSVEKFGDSLPEGAVCWLQPSGMYFIDYTL